jgi:hypothetical protein
VAWSAMDHKRRHYADLPQTPKQPLRNPELHRVAQAAALLRLTPRRLAGAGARHNLTCIKV